MGDKQIAPPSVSPAAPAPTVAPPTTTPQRMGNQAAPVPSPMLGPVATPTLDAAMCGPDEGDAFGLMTPGSWLPWATAIPTAPAAPPAAPTAPATTTTTTTTTTTPTTTTPTTTTTTPDATATAPKVDPAVEAKRIADTVQEALRSEWSLFGESKEVDPKAAIAALAGQPPEVLAAARAQYKAQTGRNLEDDLRGELDDKDSRAAMGHLWNGMNVSERAAYNDDGAAVADALKAPTPTDLELQRTDPQKYQQMRIDTAKAAIANAGGVLDDDEDEAMQVFASLSVSERKELLRQYPDVVSFMSGDEKKRFEAMATSEADAIKARAEEAMAGGGTDENALSQSMKSLKGLADEHQKLTAALAAGTLQGAEADAAKKRLEEIGDVSSLLKVERDADGNVKGFLGEVEGELSSGEFKSHLDTLGNTKEAATQAVLNATGGWFGLGTDEDAVNEAVASLPKDQREAFVKDSLVAGRISADLNVEEQATLQSFVKDDQLAMATSRVDSANGTFAQDEAKVLKTLLELSPADRAKFADTDVAKYARAQMDPLERKAYDEALTGTLSLETGMAAAAEGMGTNEDLMTLASQKKSATETEQIRTGYLLARSGQQPTTDAEREALRKYRAVEGIFDSELSTDDMQGQLDTLVGGATEDEKKTAGGRDRAAQILLARQEDKADTIGGLFTTWSETDDTAQTSAIATAASYHDGKRDGEIGASDLETMQGRDETFQTRFTEMVEAQNAATDAAATGVGAIVSAAAIAVSGGSMAPLVAAGWAALGTTATVATKALVGGDRYSAEAAGMDVLSGALSFGTSLGTGKLAEGVVKGVAPNLANGFGKTLLTASIDNGMGTVAGSVTGSLLDDKIWEKAPDQLISKVGTDLASTKNAVGFGVGTLAATAGNTIYDARTRPGTTASTTTPPATATTVDPAATAPATVDTAAPTPTTVDTAAATPAVDTTAATPAVDTTAATTDASAAVTPEAAAPAAQVEAQLTQIADAQQQVADATQQLAQTPDASGTTSPELAAQAQAAQDTAAATQQAAAEVTAVVPDAPAAVSVESSEAKTARIMGELDARLMSGQDLHLVEWALDHLNDLDAIDQVLQSHPRGR